MFNSTYEIFFVEIFRTPTHFCLPLTRELKRDRAQVVDDFFQLQLPFMFKKKKKKLATENYRTSKPQ